MGTKFRINIKDSERSIPFRTTTNKVGDAFFEKKSASSNSVTSTGDKLFSYGTVIGQRLPDGKIVGNKTKYSVTTSKHQSQTGILSKANIFVENVPIGTDDLKPFIK